VSFVSFIIVGLQIAEYSRIYHDGKVFIVFILHFNRWSVLHL